MKGSLMELHAAIRRNDVESLRREIAAGAPVNRVERERKYESVLQLAAEQRSVSLDTLKALVDAGADPRIGPLELVLRAAKTGELARVQYFESLGCPLLGATLGGYTPLHMATQEWDRLDERYELVRYLLDAGVDPDRLNQDGYFAIGHCLRSSAAQILRLLASRGAMKSVPAWPEILSAVILGDYDRVRSSPGEISATFCDNESWSSIRIALRMGELEMVELLASLGALTACRRFERRHLLFDAIQGGHTAAMDWAFDHALKGKVSKSLHEDLHRAAAGTGFLEAPRWLVGHGILPKKKPKSTNPPILYCTRLEAAEFYLDLGVDINSVQDRRGTFLMYAARCGTVGVARRLVERGANREGDPWYGNPLHAAVQVDSDEMVDFMLSLGVEVDFETFEHDTPLAEAKSLSVARKLLAAGADPDRLNMIGTVKEWLLRQDVAFSRIFGPADDAQPEASDGLGSRMELWAAIQRNDLASIQAEIDLGLPTKVFGRNGDEETILERAAAIPSVSLETLRFLVKVGADPTIHPESLIHKAAETGELDRIRYFESLGCPIDSVIEGGRSLLETAILHSPIPVDDLADTLASFNRPQLIGCCVHRKFFELARKFFDGGVPDPNYDWPEIFRAIIHKDLEGIRANRDQANERFSYKPWRPLEVAVRMSDPAMAQMLLDLGAEWQDTGFPWSRTDILSEALATGSIPIIEWAYSAQPEGLDKPIWPASPHHTVASSGSIEAARWLVEHGIEPEPTSINHCPTPELVDFYLEQGLDLNQLSGGTPLIVAVRSGSVEMVRHLIRRGAPLEARDFRGRPIHHAVEGGFEPILDLLIEAGANLGSLDDNGDAPLCLANSLAVARKLINAGADVDQEHWVHGTVRNYLLKKDVAFGRML